MLKSLQVFIMALAVFAATPARAATQWQIDPAQSRLTFTAQQGAEKFTGGFKNFAVDIMFSADDLAHSKITATIDMAGVYAGSADRDAALPGRDWFNIKDFPQAVFTTNAISPIVGIDGTERVEHYFAEGVLTIRGISKPVRLPFTLKREGGKVRAQGEVTIMRNDFGVGQGSFAGDSWVKYGVTIGVDIVATEKTAEKTTR